MLTGRVVLGYARYLGIDPETEPLLVDIAREALTDPVPPGWERHLNEEHFMPFFYSDQTGTTWQHPLLNHYLSRIDAMRAQSTPAAPTPSWAPTGPPLPPAPLAHHAQMPPPHIPYWPAQHGQLAPSLRLTPTSTQRILRHLPRMCIQWPTCIPARMARTSPRTCSHRQPCTQAWGRRWCPPRSTPPPGTIYLPRPSRLTRHR